MSAIEVVAQGGHGGAAVESASGGSGATVTLEDALSGTGNYLQLKQMAIAGNGGNASDSQAGAGGGASSSLNYANASAWHLEATVAATGGLGGTSFSDGAAGRGGDAIARATIAGNDEVTATVLSSGGHGGSSWERSGVSGGTALAYGSVTAASDGSARSWVQSYGGDGGESRGAGLSAGTGGTAGGESRAFSSSGIAWAEMTATAGNGGYGDAGAHGGRGGDVELSNAVGGATSRSLLLVQNARGGGGGTSLSARGGDGGNAISLLSYAEPGTNDVSAQVAATGGAGGAGGAGSAGGRGGNARAEVRLDSLAQLRTADATVIATGGSTRGGGAGGEAFARASVVAHGAASATAEAHGGLSSTGSGRADASSTARSMLAYGSVEARALAASPTGQANADARSYSLDSALSHARSQTEGVSGRASGLAESTGSHGLRTTATASASTNGQTEVDAQATHGANIPTLPNTSNTFWPQAFAIVNGTPDPLSVEQRLLDAPRVAAALASQAVGVIGVAGSGANHEASVNGTQTFVGSTRYEFTLPAASPVVVGLLDLVGRDSGDPIDFSFSVSNFDTTLVTQSFTTLAGAEAYFEDQPLILGTLDGMVDLVISFSFESSSDQAVGFEYLLAAGPLAAAIPEPSTWALWLGGLSLLGGLARMRDRRRTRR
ncbi:hypothetical protein CKO37_01005 [Rubrivivax gelatinosus]|nr:hypothetical protein [Rubrivivax gelatinosus]